jgi:hypothetical protein
VWPLCAQCHDVYLHSEFAAGPERLEIEELLVNRRVEVVLTFFE